MKRYLLAALQGALTGIAVQYLLSIIISAKLHLGYLMAYIAPLAEAVHGEMNAVLVEVALSAFLGAGFAIALVFARKKEWTIPKRITAISLSLIATIFPVLTATLGLFYGLM